MMLAAGLAQCLGLLPLLWLGALHIRGSRRGPGYWWLAGAFGVSFVADTVARVINPMITSLVYPIAQSAIVGALILRSQFVHSFVRTLLVIAMLAILFMPTFDVLLRSIAWISLTAAAWQRRDLGELSGVLILHFGGGLVAWWFVVVFAPGATSWLFYQGVRALGILLFCAACNRPVKAMDFA